MTTTQTLLLACSPIFFAIITIVSYWVTRFALEDVLRKRLGRFIATVDTSEMHAQARTSKDDPIDHGPLLLTELGSPYPDPELIAKGIAAMMSQLEEVNYDLLDMELAYRSALTELRKDGTQS